VISSLTQFLNFRLSLDIVHARKRKRKNKHIEISALRRVMPVDRVVAIFHYDKNDNT
jgi:hypothetical protein